MAGKNYVKYRRAGRTVDHRTPEEFEADAHAIRDRLERWSKHSGSVGQLSAIINDWSNGLGWWENAEQQSIPTKLVLIHSEVTEALESWRNGEEPDFVHPDGKPDGWGVELADVIIRCLDLATQHGLNMEDMLLRKMMYNAGRPYRHGGKRV